MANKINNKTIYLPAEEWEMIDKEAEEQDRSRAKMIHIIVKDYFDRKKKQKNKE